MENIKTQSGVKSTKPAYKLAKKTKPASKPAMDSLPAEVPFKTISIRKEMTNN